ncbi:hypothetical protein ACFL9U_14030 [Thermodesulfobacteriota bacterium]
MEFRPKCMAFTMSDVPGKRDVEEACRMMIRYFPECPTPPEPPHGGFGLRGLILGMPCVWADRKKKQIVYELSERENELTQFYDRYIAEDLDYFAIPPEYEAGLYRLSEMYKEKPWPELRLIYFAVPGIFSWGLNMVDESGTPALYNDTMRDVMIKLMAMKAKWRQTEIKKLFPGIPTLFMIANGGLSVYVSASGVGKWEDAKKIYNEVLAAVDAITAIHCCANFDWPLLMETNTDIIHFDAYQYGDSMSLYPDALKRFLDRGGMIAWGIVPSGRADQITTENSSSLMERLEKAIELVAHKGIDKNLLLESSWISPNCSMSTPTIELGERVFELTRGVSLRMREKYFG